MKKEKNEGKIFYDKYHRNQIVKAIKQFKIDNEMRRIKADGYGKAMGNGLKRPMIENIHYSWKEFGQLPKDVIIVYGFMIGCNSEYIQKLDDDNFFIPKRLLKEKEE
jgi:hypothetical protein